MDVDNYCAVLMLSLGHSGALRRPQRQKISLNLSSETDGKSNEEPTTGVGQPYLWLP